MKSKIKKKLSLLFVNLTGSNWGAPSNSDGRAHYSPNLIGRHST